MNTFDGLIARSTGTLDVARPRVPGRFESSLGSALDPAEPWREVVEERRNRPAEETSSKAEPSRETAIRAKVSWKPPEQVPQSAPEPSLTVGPTATPAAEAASSTAAEDRSPQPPRPRIGHEPSDSTASLSPSSPMESVNGPVPERAERTPKLEPPSLVPSRSTLDPSSLSPISPWSPPAPTLAAPPALQAPTPEPARSAEPAKPRVEVRIGRIDVRPAAPTSAVASSSPPRARRPRATVPLNDYLRRRGS